MVRVLLVLTTHDFRILFNAYRVLLRKASPVAQIVVKNRQDLLNYIENNPRPTPRISILYLIVMTSVFADAYDLGALSIGVDSMQAELDLTATQTGTITSATAIGALASALLGGMIADRTGRYRLFIISGVMLVIAPLGIAFSPNFETVLFFRAIMGIAVGLDMPVAFSFMAELFSKQRQAKLVNWWQPVSSFANIVGVCVALPFALAAVTGHLWRITSGVGALFALAALLLRLKYSEESPLWSAKHQKLDVAAKTLSRTYDVQVRVEADRTTAEEESQKSVPVRELFQKRFLSRTTLVSVCAFVQQLQYYGVGFYVPVIAGLIFGTDLVSTIIATVCSQGVALLAGVLGVRLTDKLGLHRLGIIGYLVVLICLVWVASIGVGGEDASLLPVILVALMLAGSAFGPGPLSKTLAAVSYPTEVRGLGTGWAETMGRLGSIVGLFFFPIVLDAVGIQTTMLIIAIFPAVALLALSTLSVEEPEDSKTKTKKDKAFQQN